MQLFNLSRTALGLLILVVVIFIWVGSSDMMQFIFDDQNYDHPFFLTYFNTSLFSIYLLGFAVSPSWRKSTKPRLPTLILNSSDQSSAHGDEEGDEDNDMQDITERHEKLKPSQVAKIALLFCPIWFFANYTFNASLSKTSVSSNTILSSTAGLWTFLISLVVKMDKFSLIKLLAVLISLGGVVIISLSDSREGGNHHIFGDLLSLISAVCYAVYVLVLKRKIPDETKVHMPMFFGFVGLFNIFLLFPFGVVLSLTGVDKAEIPSAKVFGFLACNALIGTVLSDYLWMKSMLLTSPLIATVGLSLTIPLAMLSDIIIQDLSFSPLYFLGSFLVFTGFIMVNTEAKIRQLCGKIPLPAPLDRLLFSQSEEQVDASPSEDD